MFPSHARRSCCIIERCQLDCVALVLSERVTIELGLFRWAWHGYCGWRGGGRFNSAVLSLALYSVFYVGAVCRSMLLWFFLLGSGEYEMDQLLVLCPVDAFTDAGCAL